MINRWSIRHLLGAARPPVATLRWWWHLVLVNPTHTIETTIGDAP